MYALLKWVSWCSFCNLCEWASWYYSFDQCIHIAQRSIMNFCKISFDSKVGSGRFRFGSFLNNRLKWSVGRHLSDHNALIRFWFNGLVLSPWARPLCCWLHWSLEQPAPQLCNSLSFSLQFTFDFNSFHIYDLGLSLFQSQCTRHCHKSYWTCTGTVKPVLKRGVYIKENRVYWLLYSLLFYDT